MSCRHEKKSAETATWKCFEDNEIYRENREKHLESTKATSTGGESRGPPFYFKEDSYVYVLECEGDTYYVGLSRNIEKRLTSHFCGEGSQWTKFHHPIRVLKTYPKSESQETLEMLEQRITKYYMRIHGVKNVRGGPWAHPCIDECPLLPEDLRETDSDENDSDNLDKITETYF